MTNTAHDVGVADDPAAFVRKWRAHWPEWSIAEVFVPKHMRERVDAWEALQFELTEAAWGGDDARPGEAKLGWWTEELHGWANGRRRHPIGGVLQRLPLPWSALARAVPSLRASRERPSDADDAWRQLEAAALAASDVEAGLFEQPCDARAIAACWLASRLARHAATAVPISNLAHGEPALPEWTGQLLTAWPRGVVAARPRRLIAALAHARLQRGDAHAALGPWATLRIGWRTARK